MPLSTLARGAKHIALATFALAALTACEFDFRTSSTENTVVTPGSTGVPAGLLGSTVGSTSTATEFTFVGNRFQTYSVTKDGWYFLDVRGAQGGAASNGSHRGGFGARMQGYVQLKTGDSLRIAVGGMGQVGSNDGNNVAGGGGGGATSIAKLNGSVYEPLVIASGGGGGAADYYGSPGLAGQSGGFDNGGTNGAGGGIGASNYGGAGGGGFTGSGGSHYSGSVLLSQGGAAYDAGNIGGTSASNGGKGGFGGGGQGGPAKSSLFTNYDGGGGGGGGYSGGAGGPNERNGGAGGGSFLAALVNTNFSLAQQGANSGDGRASILAATPPLEPADQIATIGQPVTLGPVGQDSSGQVTYQWMKDGTLLPGQTGASLSLASFKFTDSGAYQVVLHSDERGTHITRPAFLTASTGTVLAAWGENTFGELGLGDLKDRLVPTVVPGSNDVVSVASGTGYTLFVKRDGTLWAMGRNRGGQLGLGDGLDRAEPVQVPGISDAIAVAAGERHALLLKRDGKLYGAGASGSVEMSLGHLLRFDSLGYAHDMWSTLSFMQLVVTQTEIVDNVVAVAAGGAHSLFVKRDGSLWVMGYNKFGQTGTGESNCEALLGTCYSNVPVPTQLTGITDVVAVAAAGDNSMFMKRDGTLWGFGSNASGELGLGDKNIRYTPNQFPTSSNLAMALVGDRQTHYPAVVCTDVIVDGLGCVARDAYDSAPFGHSLVVSNPNSTVSSSGANIYGAGGGIGTFADAAAVSMARNSALLLKRDGTLWVAGKYPGDGSATATTPTQVYFRDANNSALTPLSVATLSRQSNGQHLLVVTQAP